jgi:hypothetical protein
MAGIFDTGIFDTGIFDHAAVAPPGVVTPPSYGGGGARGRPAPIWSEVSWLKKKKKPDKEDLIEEVAEVVEQVAPEVNEEESRLIAVRLLEQITWAQLRRLQTLEAFAAKVEAELAELDDEEVLLLAA